jgi:hypothetical protein
MLAFAALFSYAASRFPVLPFDLKSYKELKEQTGPLFDGLMIGVSYLGELMIAMALTAIAMAIFAFRRQWLEAIFILATTSSVLLAFALKDLIHRTRPFPNSSKCHWIHTEHQPIQLSKRACPIFCRLFWILRLSRVDKFCWNCACDHYLYFRFADRSNRTVTRISWHTLGERCFG